MKKIQLICTMIGTSFKPMSTPPKNDSYLPVNLCYFKIDMVMTNAIYVFNIS